MPARWQRTAARAPRPDWLIRENDSFIAGRNVANSFGMKAAVVVVRYRGAGFDATVARVAKEIAQGGAGALLACLAVAAVLLPLLIKRKDAAA